MKRRLCTGTPDASCEIDVNHKSSLYPFRGIDCSPVCSDLVIFLQCCVSVVPDKTCMQLQAGLVSIVFCAISVPADFALRLVSSAAVPADLVDGILYGLRVTWVCQSKPATGLHNTASH